VNKNEDEDDEEECEVRSGKYDKDNIKFLTFPGKMNKTSVKPVIDTGGGCNLVNSQWLKENNIEVMPDPNNSYKILMADGSTSKNCPCISVRWTFDSNPKTLWKDVDFIVVEDYHYDALLGLPFLRVTEMIHNSEGDLVFLEFRGQHLEKNTIPLYDQRVKKSTWLLGCIKIAQLLHYISQFLTLSKTAAIFQKEVPASMHGWRCGLLTAPP
jgi:hypothetical protein